MIVTLSTATVIFFHITIAMSLSWCKRAFNIFLFTTPESGVNLEVAIDFNINIKRKKIRKIAKMRKDVNTSNVKQNSVSMQLKLAFFSNFFIISHYFEYFMDA